MATVETKAPYEAERTEKGLLIKGFHLSKHTPAGVKGLVRPLDAVMFQEFIENFELRKNQDIDGELAPKKGAFVLPAHYANKGIGWIENLWVEKDILMGDIMITHPEAIEAVLREEYTERSIEFVETTPDHLPYDGKALLKGVALLSGTFGYDSLGFPDLVVTIKSEDFSVDGVRTVSYEGDLKVKSITEPSEATMDLKNENESLKARIKELESADPVKMVEQEAEKLVATRLKEMEERESNRELDHYCSTLSDRTGMSKAVLRAKFDREASTPGERRILFNALMQTGVGKAAMEQDWVQPSQEELIRKHFHERGGKEKFNMTEDEYVNVARKIL
jgi:hypothetical protein